MNKDIIVLPHPSELKERAAYESNARPIQDKFDYMQGWNEAILYLREFHKIGTSGN